MEICSECRSRLPQGAEVCPSCGRPVTVAYVLPGEPGPGGRSPWRGRRRSAGWAVGLLAAAALAWAATRGPTEPPAEPTPPTSGGGATAGAASPAGTARVPFELEGPLALSVEDARGMRRVVLLDGDGRLYSLGLRAPGTGEPLGMLFAQEGSLVLAGVETTWALSTGELLGRIVAARTREPPGPLPGRTEAAVVLDPRALLPLGRGEQALPGAGGSIWLSARFGPGRFVVRRAPLDGGAVPEWVALPPRLRPVAGLRVGVAGLRGGRLEVWLPESGVKVFEGGPPARVLAAHEDLLAWVGPPCAGSCSLHVTDVRHEADEVLLSPQGRLELNGPAGFSPNGRTLALFGRLPGGEPLLVLVQPRSGRVSLLPLGVRPGADCSPCLAWFLSGRRLVFVTDAGTLRGLEVETGGLEVETGTARAVPHSVEGRVVGVAAL
ncbi:MAG TPA: hypothetical protein VNO34_10935 [Actinomycetota bacterium]|nr:hypothetical protein [Actinomycetota bacterium]